MASPRASALLSRRPSGRTIGGDHWLLPLLLWAALSALSAPAHAQDAGDEEARRLFLEGAESYAAEDYEAAAASFARSHALRPVPVVLFNLAQALRFAGHPGAALRAFRGYLEAEAEPGAQRRRAVEAAITELEQEVGYVQLSVEPEPSGALTIELDGQELRDVTPAEPFAVGPGAHRITVRAEGAEGADPATGRITVASGATAVLRLSLGAPQATLSIQSVEGARVRVDGEDVGAAPLDLRVDAGRGHEVVITAPNHEPLTREVELAAGESLSLDLELERRRLLRDQWWLWAIIGGSAVTALVLSLAIGLPQRDADPLEGTLPTIHAITWSGR